MEHQSASPSNVDLVNSWYDALATGDMERFISLHAPDVTYNISGHTPISGQVRGIKPLLEHVFPVVFAALDLSKARFGKKRKIMCADAERVVGMMEADGPAKNGVHYDQRYVHIFAFREGKINVVWEFFDTALANDAVFHDVPTPIAGVDAGGFDF